MTERPKKLPGNVNHLQRLLRTTADERGMPPVRLQHRLNSMIVTAVLDRARDEDDEPVFLLKGGVAMELRLQLRARATSDYDAAFRACGDEVIGQIDEALTDVYNGFTITRDAPEPIRNMGNELDRVEGAKLDELQVPLPETVACVSVRYQVAQKLHACTEVFDTPPENDRFRDVIDILLVEDLIRTPSASPARAKPAWTSSPSATSTVGHQP